LGKRRGFGECKRGGSKVQEEGKYRSKMTRAVRHGRRKEL